MVDHGGSWWISTLPSSDDKWQGHWWKALSFLNLTPCPCNQVAVVWSPNPSHASGFEFCCGQTLSGQTWKMEDSPLADASERNRTKLESKMDAWMEPDAPFCWAITSESYLGSAEVSNKRRSHRDPFDTSTLTVSWHQIIWTFHSYYRFSIGSNCCPDCQMLCYKRIKQASWCSWPQPEYPCTGEWKVLRAWRLCSNITARSNTPKLMVWGLKTIKTS